MGGSQKIKFAEYLLYIFVIIGVGIQKLYCRLYIRKVTKLFRRDLIFSVGGGAVYAPRTGIGLNYIQAEKH